MQAALEIEAFRNAPLTSSGLPPRIRAALRAAGAETLGDLCHPLACTLGDADDRSLVDRISRWFSAACQAPSPPLSLPEWLSLFLPPRLVDTVKLHYALDTPSAALSLHEASLSATGFKLGVSRERARQLLASALQTLRQPLPMHAAEPLFASAVQTLRAHGGLIDAPGLAGTSHPAWKGLSPVGIFVLLARLRPGFIVMYRDIFSLLSDTALERVEKDILDQLERAAELLSIQEMAARLPRGVFSGERADPVAVLTTLLRHLPGAFATLDGRAGRSSRDEPHVLHEILAEEGDSPLRQLVEIFNRRVHPECRRGSGHLRTLLNRDPHIRRTAPGRYALPGGLQTRLPLAP